MLQKITGWVSQYSAVVTSIGGPILSTTTERSEIINYAEKVLQILTNKERETSTKKRSAKEELFVSFLFILLKRRFLFILFLFFILSQGTAIEEAFCIISLNV